MDGCMDGCMYGWIDGCMYGWMAGCMDGWMDIWNMLFGELSPVKRVSVCIL